MWVTVFTFVLRSLNCQRITLHKNLFISFVLNSIVTVIWLTTVVNKQGHAYHDSVRPCYNNKLICVMLQTDRLTLCDATG